MNRREVYLPQWVVPAFKTGLAALGGVAAVLAVVTLVLVLRALDQITEVQCGTHATIERILRGQDDPGQRERQAKVYARLGFSPDGIAILFAEQEAGRAATLRILGPTPSRCLSPSAASRRVEWPYPIPSWRN